MANYIAYCTNKGVLPSEHIAHVKVPSGGLNAGSIVLLSSLDSGDTTNLEVFTATQPTTAALGATDFAIVVNGGFERLTDGRRPAGQPNFTTYSFAAGEVVTAIYLDKHLTFEVSLDCTTGGTTATPSSDIGKYIIPANGVYTGAVNASNANVGNSLKIIGVRNFPIGGLGVSGYVTTYLCRAC